MNAHARLGRAGPAAAALIIAGLLVAACGEQSSGSRVAGEGSATSTPDGSSSGGSKRADGLAYARCMRSHGVPNFPDPNSKGEITLDSSPGNGLDLDSPQMQSAMQACKDLQPGPGKAEQERAFAEGLRFAKCMRANGVPDFPDPQPPGSGPTTQRNENGSQGAQGSGGVDPESPQYKRAEQACRKYLSGGSEPSTQSSGDGP
jgi:hypothetical protein